MLNKINKSEVGFSLYTIVNGSPFFHAVGHSMHIISKHLHSIQLDVCVVLSSSTSSIDHIHIFKSVLH